MDFPVGTDFFSAVDYSPRSLFKRCVKCPPTTLSCPTCKSGEVCVQITENCNQCASRKCVSSIDSGQTGTITNSGGRTGPNVGAIAGGVVGGVAFIAIATYLVWRFCIKNRREKWEEEFEEEFQETSEKEGAAGARPSGDLAASLHTRNSIASTMLTRASNVIPIAFIPGIVDRSGHQPEYSVPPVPPIPIPTSRSAAQALSPYSDHQGDTYFMPGDLRDSTYSGFSDDGASSITGRSLANSLLRGSVASTIYPVSSAVPVQTAHRARAAVVSVKHSGATTPVPAVPRIDYARYGRPGSQATTGTQETGGIVLNEGAFSLNSALAASSSPTSPITIPAASGLVARSSSVNNTVGNMPKPAPPNLAAVIEEATRRASRQPLHGGLGSVRRDDSPFSDDYAIPEI